MSIFWRLRKIPKILLKEKNVQGRWFRLLIGTAIGLFLFYYSFREVDWVIFWQSFGKTNLWFLLPALLGVVVYLLIKAWRWQILLENGLDISKKRIWQSSVIGAAFNIFLPYLGEAVRGIRVGQGKDKSFIFSTIIFEKIIDSVFLLLVIYFFSYYLEFPDWFRNGINIFSYFVLVALLVALIIPKIRSILPQWAGGKLASEFLNWKLLVRLFLITILSWLVLTLVYAQVAASLGIMLSFWAYLFLVCFLYIGLSIPSAPGYIGVYQFLILFGLSFFGVGKELALAYSFVIYLALALPTGLLGWYYLVKG